MFNYEAASDKFTPDAKSPSDRGHTCHVAVKAKDYIFHPSRNVEARVARHQEPRVELYRRLQVMN